MRYDTINRITGLDTVSESTDAKKTNLRVARNLLLRPVGGVKRIPKYSRLWGMLNLSTYNASLGLTAGSGTCLLQIVNEGKVILAFWDVLNSKTLGVIYAGDTGDFSNPVTLTSGTATVTVLKTGLAPSKRWYCYRFYDEIWMGNGVDANLIYQYSRTSLRLRTAGSNSSPTPPTLSITNPLSTATTQAKRAIAFGPTVLTITANTSNFIGASGNYIQVAFTTNPSAGSPITSTRTGAGTSVNPYVFTFTLKTGASEPTMNNINTFINADSNCTGIITSALSTSDPVARARAVSLGYLSGGVGAVTNVQAKRTITAGSTTLTFQADTLNFKGTSGHNIEVAIVPSGLDQAISSTRTGAGTAASKFSFTFTIGTSSDQSSPHAITLFVASDPNCLGILTASASAIDSTPNPTLSAAAAALSGGVDATTSVGFKSGETRKIALTYWDRGSNSAGYETALCEERSILNNTSTGKDILVGIIGNTSGELSRFGYQRIYLYVGTEWQCVATVPNTTATHRVGSDFTISATYSSDQKRIPPCTIFELFSGKMWSAGNPGNPSRVWVSKYATADEIVPEGVDITFYLEISGRSDDPEQPIISAMRSINQSDIHIATQKTITPVDGVTFSRNSLSRVVSGPVNPACFAPFAGVGCPYIGADGQLYEFRGYSRSSDSDTLDLLAIGAMREAIDTDAMRRTPHRANMISDPVNRLLWLWVPDTSGVLTGFIYDYASKSVTGPFDWPKLLSSTQVGVADNRFIGCDEGGNLFVFDTSSISLPDPYPTSSPLTYQAIPYTPPAAEAGYGTVTLAGGVLRKAATTVLTTAFLDFGSPNRRKGFYSLEWTTIRNSRAIVSITLTSDLGRSVSRTYGDVYGRERHKITFCLSGHAVQITLQATTAEDAEFAIRDLTIGYEEQGTR